MYSFVSGTNILRCIYTYGTVLDVYFAEVRFYDAKLCAAQCSPVEMGIYSPADLF